MKPTASSEASHFYNYSDVYAPSATIQTAGNQFINYQNYNHDQLMHHQYFDENLHHYVPYNSNSNVVAENYPATHDIPCYHQENFPPVQTNNELYEFLPEEIFQLDQPIIKNEVAPPVTVQIQQFNEAQIMDSNSISSYASTNGIDVQPNQSFLDLGSGEIQNNSSKYLNFSEINNNSHYNNQATTIQVQPLTATKQHDSYGCHHQDTFRVNCSVENAKMKLKQYEIDQIIKHSHSPSSFYQNYPNIQQLSKRDSSNLYATHTNYYAPPEIYANSLHRNDVMNN